MGIGTGGGRDSALHTRDDGRSSMGSNYTGFGLLGKAKRKDDEDDLDNILGSLEQKKGIETTTKKTTDLKGSFGFGAASQSNRKDNKVKQEIDVIGGCVGKGHLR